MALALISELRRLVICAMFAVIMCNVAAIAIYVLHGRI